MNKILYHFLNLNEHLSRKKRKVASDHIKTRRQAQRSLKSIEKQKLLMEVKTVVCV
jgi:hypothetical protein